MHLSAQVKDKGIPFINHHSKQEYLAGTQNWDFVQSDNHVLYIANFEGVLRFDGLEWDLIEMPNRSLVRCLFKDDDNTIYVGAYNEFGYLQPDSTGSLIYKSLINNISMDEPGEFWKITRQGNFYYFQSYDVLVIYNKEKDYWYTIEPDFTFGFLQHVEDKVYLNNRGLGLMELKDGVLSKIPGGEFFAENEVWVILKINNELIVGTQNNGLFVFNDGNAIPWDTEINEFLLKNKLFSFEQTTENLFWGSIQDGLAVTDYKGSIITHLNKQTGLNNNTILSLFLDAQQNLWLGLDNGIDQVLIHSPLSYLRTQNDIGAGYAATMYNGRIYLGTNQGLFWIPAQSGRDGYSRIPIAQSVPECSGQVWSLKVQGDELLVAHNRGAFAIKNEKIRQIYDGSGSWNFHEIPGDEEHLIQGTYSGLVVYRKGETGLEYDFKVDGFNMSSRVLIFENKKTLWIGHGYEGIFKIELSSDLRSIEEIKSFGTESGLGTDNFNEPFKIDESIVVGNSDGIFFYDDIKDDFVKSELWTNAFSEGGRMTAVIQQGRDNYFYFQDGSSGNLKIFSDTLLIKDQAVMAPLNHSFIPPFENISTMENEGLLIGTDNGFVHLDMNMALRNTKKIPFHFKSLSSLHYQSDYRIDLEFAGVLSSDFPDHPLNKIPYRHNDLSISFVASFLTYPDQTKYQFFLEGQSKKWSEWSEKNSIDFTNLREGEYTFRVKAKNVFGDISDEQQLFFHILTPWHRSLLAYISYFLLFAIGMLVFWKLSNDRLEREKRRSKLLEERRMLHQQLKLKRDSELAEKEIVELRNDKLRAGIRHKSKELANQTMGLMQKNRFLTEIKEEMVQMKKVAKSDDVKNSLRRIMKKIDRSIEDENAQKVFEINFDQVHENFLLCLREAYPDLTAKDLRLCAYLRLNLSSKEIAPLLNISIRGVEISRYRLRKKLKLSHDESLIDFILRF